MRILKSSKLHQAIKRISRLIYPSPEFNFPKIGNLDQMKQAHRDPHFSSQFLRPKNSLFLHIALYSKEYLSLTILTIARK